MSVPPERQDENLGGLSVRPGDVLLQKYRLERLIGQGGTGVVVSAIDVERGQRVAIKFLKPALESEELRARFEGEAKAMAKIQSEHVARVLDTGTLDSGAPFMVLEHLEGRDLSVVLKDDGPLAPEIAVDCMVQVCDALAHAHAHGIIHRDLKPANMLLTMRAGRGHVKVVDFGISKLLDPSLAAAGFRDMTAMNTMLGSPRYTAPEQMRNSKAVDARADLWSIGAVLFQLLTGRHAFDGASNAAACQSVLTTEAHRVREFAAHVPEGLDAIVARCLTKDVTQRFQTATELADALRPFGSTTKTSFPGIQLSRAPGAPSRLGLVGLAAASFVLVLGALLVVQRIFFVGAGRGTARFTAEPVPLVPLDAGKGPP